MTQQTIQSGGWSESWYSIFWNWIDWVLSFFFGDSKKNRRKGRKQKGGGGGFFYYLFWIWAAICQLFGCNPMNRWFDDY